VGETLAVSDGNSFYLWDVAAGQRIGTVDELGLFSYSLVFRPDGSMAAAVQDGDSGSTYLLQVPTGHLMATLNDPDSIISSATSAVFSPDGKTLAVGDQNGSTYLWNTATGRVLAILGDPAESSDPTGIGVNSVAFSPDGKTLATGDYDGNTFLWDVGVGH
jgi:WD40 repeat protein